MVHNFTLSSYTKIEYLLKKTSSTTLKIRYEKLMTKGQPIKFLISQASFIGNEFHWVLLLRKEPNFYQTYCLFIMPDNILNKMP